MYQIILLLGNSSSSVSFYFILFFLYMPIYFEIRIHLCSLIVILQNIHCTYSFNERIYILHYIRNKERKYNCLYCRKVLVIQMSLQTDDALVCLFQLYPPHFHSFQFGFFCPHCSKKGPFVFLKRFNDFFKLRQYSNEYLY